MSGLLRSMWDNKGEVFGGLFDMFTEDNVLKSIDKRVSNLENLGVPKGLLYGRETTTEPNLYKSTANAIYNLPSQVPRLAKDVVSAVYNPLDFVEGVHSAGQGLMTNAADVFYDAVLPDSLSAKLKENQPDSITQNEKMMESVGEALLDPQVRREIGQQYGIEGLLGYASIPKNLAKLSNKQTQFLERVVEDTAPFGNTIGTQMFGTRKSSTWNKEKFGEQEDAKAKAKLMFEEMGITRDSINQVFKETNYFITPKGELVHHINDVDMAFTPKVINELNDLPKDVEYNGMLGTYKAKDVFTHPELFRNYPELEDYNITLLAGLTRKDGSVSEVGRGADNKFVPTGLQGRINHPNKEITIYVDQSKGLTSDHKGILLHEIQHGVQDLDNMSPGGNQSVTYMAGLKKALETEDAMLLDILNDPRGERTFNLSDTAIFNIDKRRQDIEASLESLEIAATDPMTVSPKEAKVLQRVRSNVYTALEGEWLARLTQREKDVYEAIQQAVDFEGKGLSLIHI